MSTNNEQNLLLLPNTLWPKVKAQTSHALTVGALKSIPTEWEIVADQGVDFLVRIVSNLDRKETADKQQAKQLAETGKEFNPFLPYETDLFVTDISDSHLCLLNKFNVVDYHLLIVTRAFEEQDNLLNFADFLALWVCLSEIDGLGFYNGGKLAGASQKHKHLQLIPRVIDEKMMPIPIEPLIKLVKWEGIIGKISTLPFTHAVAQLAPHYLTSPVTAAEHILDLYHQLLNAIEITEKAEEPTKVSGAYNLLVTREWLFVVPRTQGIFQTIGVNSLGFAGNFLVKNSLELQLLKEVKPMTILQSVSR